MPIELPDPIVVPEKVFDQMYMSQLIILAPGPGQEASIRLTLLPMNSETGELDPLNGRTITIDNPFARMMAGDTELSTIMQLIFDYAQKELNSAEPA